MDELFGIELRAEMPSRVAPGYSGEGEEIIEK